MKRFMVCLISIFCILGLLEKNVSAEDTVKVGILLPLTGSQAEFGDIEKKSFDLALEEINASGGINGKKLELVIKDDTGRLEVGRFVVEKLITKDKVVMIEGAGGFTLPEFMQNAGIASEKVISTTLWNQVLPFPGAMDYYKKFETKYNKSTMYYGTEAYSACYVIADVLKRTTSFTNTDIKQALSETDMMTVFGPVKFINWGNMTNQNKATAYVVQWIDGKLEVVWPTDHATKTFVYPVDWIKTWGY